MAKRATKQKTQPHEADPFLSLREAGEQLGVHPRTIGRWLTDPDIPFTGHSMPGGVRVRQSEVDKWIGTPLDTRSG